MVGWSGGRREVRNRRAFFVSAQQQSDVQEAESVKVEEEQEQEQVQTQKPKPKGTKPRPVEPQVNVKSKNMLREYGGQWLSCATRHVRIYAAYIDPVTCEFDQTQMDKLTLILDPTDEFVWNPETCNLVYSYFQELVDHYEVCTFLKTQSKLFLFSVSYNSVTCNDKTLGFLHYHLIIIYIKIIVFCNDSFKSMHKFYHENNLNSTYH